MDEVQDLLSQAITKVRNKNTASTTVDNPKFSPEEKYKSYFKLLDVWETEYDDEEVNSKAKFIHEYLSSNGRLPVRNQLYKIFQKLGATPPTSRKIDRVYHYLNLMNEAKSTRMHERQLEADMNALRKR